MTKTNRFALICLGWIAVGLAAIWSLADSGISEISRHGVIAMAIGVVLTIGLAVALMTLTFYSDRRNEG